MYFRNHGRSPAVLRTERSDDRRRVDEGMTLAVALLRSLSCDARHWVR